MRPARGESWASPLSLSSCQDLKAGTGSGDREGTDEREVRVSGVSSGREADQRVNNFSEAGIGHSRRKAKKFPGRALLS